MHTVSCRHLLPVAGLAVLLLAACIPSATADNATPGSSYPGSNISILTSPVGAAVYLNGEYRGVTPLKIQYLAPGTYVADIRLNGYRNETVERTLNGTKFDIGINLEPLSSLAAPAGNGSVAIDSNPGGAAVTFDGTAAGKTPAGHAALVLNDVPAGNHTVSVELAGYPVHTETVTVRKNRVVQVSAGFIPETSSPTGTPAAGPTEKSPLPPLAAAAAIAVLAALSRRS